MEPMGRDAGVAERLRLSPRKLAIAGGALVVVVVAVVAVVVLSSRQSGPDQNDVAAELKAAITEFAPAGSSGGSSSTARFDTGALRTRLEASLEGWNIDLAADSAATRVGAAARQNDGKSCVFAWSDVGAPRSAVVTDPSLPCVAEVALIPAKSPA